MVGIKRPSSNGVVAGPGDLASRIGMRAASASAPAVPESIRRVDGPIEPARPQRGRPLMIGANEPPPARPIDTREPDRAAPAARPPMIGLERPVAAVPAPTIVSGPIFSEPVGPSARVFATREAPAVGEMDLVVTPLATPDDWHHFELALRRVPGVGALRIEYYRAGILKLRLCWSGPERFADAVTTVPGYRVGILGEDRSTVQIRVARN